MRSAYFAGGCFWCITPFFKMQDGVLEVTAGYSGGDEENPVYEDVKHQKTGHRETIKIDYEPELIGYDELIDMFLESVDPYDGEGQFIDKGFSYTLAIYPENEEEAEIAKAAVNALAAASDQPVFVAVEPFKSFWRAEEYHQDYYLKNPEAFEKEMIESGRKEA